MGLKTAFISNRHITTRFKIAQMKYTVKLVTNGSTMAKSVISNFSNFYFILFFIFLTANKQHCARTDCRTAIVGISGSSDLVGFKSLMW